MIASRRNLSDAPAFAKLVIVTTTQRIRRGLCESAGYRLHAIDDPKKPLYIKSATAAQ
jgi:hypothetical protein